MKLEIKALNNPRQKCYTHNYMKSIKLFTFTSILLFGLTTSVFASWWNPFTWSIFKKNNITIQKQEEKVEEIILQKEEKKDLVNEKTSDVKKEEVVNVNNYPFIKKISPTSGSLGTKVEISGVNLLNPRDKMLFIFEKNDGTKIVLSEEGWISHESSGGRAIVSIKEPCKKGETFYSEGNDATPPGNYICKFEPITPGIYNVYTSVWYDSDSSIHKSNSVTFTVTP